MTASLPSTLIVGPRGGDDVCGALRQRGATCFSVPDVPTALAQLRARAFDAIVIPWAGSTDIETLSGEDPELKFVVECGSEDASAAVAAGADEVVEPPVAVESLVHALERLARHERPAGPDSPPPPPVGGVLLGESRAMQKVADMVSRAAAGIATVLIRGESGTGKELVARAIHANGGRCKAPFVKVHCAALPDNLLESELFGYEKGAFTGATARKPGRVEIAEGGTLFLDEIGDVTPAIQVKLLRLLQDREYERLGSVETKRANVRFVTATHRDLEGMVKKGEFREDLFYRLNVVPLWMPPLRARRGDVELLAESFCRTFGEANGRPDVRLTPEAVTLLRAQRWPGNVRQLVNLIERLVVLTDADVITEADITRELNPNTPFSTQMSTAGLSSSVSVAAPASSRVLPLSEEVRVAERRALEKALKHSNGNRTLAARILGVSRATLYNKLAEHDIG